ncbi:MAG: FkbM family methyltransferase [Promethearchaeota archaeon]
MWKSLAIVLEFINSRINRYKLDKLIPDKHYLVRCPGGKIYLNLREAISERAKFLGYYEFQKTQLFKKLVKPGMTILDIGTNKGYFTLLSAKKMKDEGEILSFEPHPENYYWIKKSISANGYKSIKLFQIALFNKNGEMRLFEGSKSGHHSLVRNKDLGSITIPTKKLDDILADQKISRVDLIKIDVEGAEIQVLEGANNLLTQQSPKLLIDIHEIDRKKIFRILEKFGFKIFDYSNNGLVKIDEKEFISKKIKEIFAKK